MLFFTESHIYENQTGVHTLPGYSSIHKPQDSNRNHHGLATYFRDNLQCQQLQLPQTEHLEILGVQLQYQNAPSIAFVLIYRSPSVSSSELLTDLAALLKACESLPYSVLLGDFNDDALAPQYQTLKSFMDKYLYMFRQASTSHKLGSCLDHVYLSRGLQSMYSNCTYHPTYFSDHYYVITQLQRPH
jgi:endonuclease/exonuclease/phosphatase family metal-dependent hydrolase